MKVVNFAMTRTGKLSLKLQTLNYLLKLIEPSVGIGGSQKQVEKRPQCIALFDST